MKEVNEIPKRILFARVAKQLNGQHVDADGFHHRQILLHLLRIVEARHQKALHVKVKLSDVFYRSFIEVAAQIRFSDIGYGFLQFIDLHDIENFPFMAVHI